ACTNAGRTSVATQSESERDMRRASWRSGLSGGRERRRAEVDAEPAAPDGGRAVLREVEIRRDVVVLVAAVPLDRTEIDEARFLHGRVRSEEHTSELQSRGHLVCGLLLEKKKGVQGALRRQRGR